MSPEFIIFGTKWVIRVKDTRLCSADYGLTVRVYLTKLKSHGSHNSELKGSLETELLIFLTWAPPSFFEMVFLCSSGWPWTHSPPSQAPESWDYRFVSPCLDSLIFKRKFQSVAWVSLVGDCHLTQPPNSCPDCSPWAKQWMSTKAIPNARITWSSIGLTFSFVGKWLPYGVNILGRPDSVVAQNEVSLISIRLLSGPSWQRSAAREAPVVECLQEALGLWRLVQMQECPTRAARSGLERSWEQALVVVFWA